MPAAVPQIQTFLNLSKTLCNDPLDKTRMFSPGESAFFLKKKVFDTVGPKEKKRCFVLCDAETVMLKL